jgi:hypothetical protein
MIKFSNLFKKIQEEKHTPKEATKMLKEAFSDKQKQMNTLNNGLQELKKLESTKENVTSSMNLFFHFRFCPRFRKLKNRKKRKK